MDKNLGKVAFVVFVCCIGFFTTEAMSSIIIQNKMNSDLFIENFQTKGSVVLNQVDLSGNCVERQKGTACIEIIVDSPVCNSEENSVTLSVFDKKDEEYKPVTIMWGDNGVYTKNYVVEGSHRVTQCSNGKSIVLTFYEDEGAVIEQLKLLALARLKSNNSSQQKQDENAILKYSGLRKEDVLNWKVN